MKEQEPNPKSPQEPEGENPSASLDREKSPGAAAPSSDKSIRGQITGLLLLLPVFGLLFAITQFGPSAADALTGKVKGAFGDEAEAVETEQSAEAPEPEAVASTQDGKVVPAEPPVVAQPEAAEKARPTVSEPASTGSAPPEMTKAYETFLKNQLQAALIGRETEGAEVDIQYLDFTDDRQRLMAAFKVTPKDGSPRLGEYLFSWNEFRQYVSTNHADPSQRIVLRTRGFQPE